MSTPYFIKATLIWNKQPTMINFGNIVHIFRSASTEETIIVPIGVTGEEGLVAVTETPEQLMQQL